jgi:hypothetical protein
LKDKKYTKNLLPTVTHPSAVVNNPSPNNKKLSLRLYGGAVIKFVRNGFDFTKTRDMTYYHMIKIPKIIKENQFQQNHNNTR